MTNIQYKMKNVLVICGPTASGKTSLALSIAKEYINCHSGSQSRLGDLDPESRSSSLRGVKRRGNLTPPSSVHILSADSSPVIPDLIRDPSPSVIASPDIAGRGNLTPPTRVTILSADSRQIYKDLDVVTGKDLPLDLSPNIKFFGLDLVSHDQPFNLSDYVRYAKKVIQESLDKNIPLIIVGGTGLYLKAITTNLLSVNVPPDKVLRKSLEKLDLISLQKKLKQINLEKFLSLNHSDVNNPRRLIRAIEISSSSSTGSLPVIPAKAGIHQITQPNFHWIGLRQDKVVQNTSIRQRVIDRLDTGALEEVERLIKEYPEGTLSLFTSLGVKQIIEYLNKKISREELVDQWSATEIDYARRQTVWFQKQPGIIWYDKSKVNKKLVEKLARIFKQND